MTIDVLRYAAFTMDGDGGNPAGVVLDARGLDAEQMQAIAADVGYSETAFLVKRPDEPNAYDVRYFAPLQEVPFCGHATIAAAVALVERFPADELIFHIPAGLVTIATFQNDEGELVAELTSVAPRTAQPEPGLVSAALQALRWSADDLDPEYPVLLANAGSEHLVLVTKTRQRLADLNYDFDTLAALMRDHGLVTLQLIWPETEKRYHSRNPFAGSGVVEDPATGAAAAAFGGYLRELEMIGEDAAFTIIQGVDMGRPSKLDVSVVSGEPGVRVTGAAHLIDAPAVNG
ncbi:MAG TPA: PhzF family phenazine biosynthesis protein [Propionibacteriaceae bacterium]|nr:PhzF family phenazine biosynthesis protein [Propionibacteriaceae bacterium]